MMRRWNRWCALRQCLCLRWRRKKCSLIFFFFVFGGVLLILSLISFGYAFRHQLFDIFMKCEDENSLVYIDDYCQAYRQGQITGSLCRPLCESRQVQFQSCTNFHAGKRVSIMSCSDFCVPGQTVSAVLKYPNDNISVVLSDHPESFPEESEASSFYLYTGNMIRDALKLEVGFVPFPLEANLTEIMWERGSHKYTDSTQAKRAAFRSIMMVIDQSEYKMVKALESSDVVPQIYGTCGAMYLQESCPPAVLDDAAASYVDPKHVPVPWEQKATTIIQLLDLIRRLEQQFPQVLHLCDVKETNFGVCADGSMKVIDADSVFFEGPMMETLQSSECQTHEDCNFFDCGGWCQTEAGKCYSAITNNNLQTVCRDVLTSEIPRVLGGGSIFSSAPASIAPKLQTLLDECLTQSSVEQGHIPVHKPALSLLTRLTKLLLLSFSQMDGNL
ncbi:hypothetical protein ACOMHN_045231 [Nucella lapillus]